MKSKTIRAGLVGTGFAASFHLEAIKKVYATKIEVIGAFSRTKEKRRAFCDKHDIQAFDSFESLLDEVDVVHICVPTWVHESMTIATLERDKFAIVEKPLTGYFGDGTEDFNGDKFPKQLALDEALQSIERMIEAEKKSKGKILYAENWVYAPSIQKEREIIEKTGAQILWLHAEQSHSGSHAPTYAFWKFSGGGVMIAKGCHPLSAALYLKQVEGNARNGKAIRPKAVSAHAHALTRLENFEDKGHIRADYHDIDDFSMMHVIFEDGTIADIFASDIVMGGVHNWVEVVANNHRTICNINPNTSMQTYNPVDDYFKDVYVVEKIGTKQGWTFPSPGEDWFHGYPQEIESFYRSVAYDEPVDSNSLLAADCMSTVYSAYVSSEKSGAEVAIKTF